MFGCDYYRGNMTPHARLVEAKRKLDDANAHLDRAQSEFDKAVAEVEAFERLTCPMSQT